MLLLKLVEMYVVVSGKLELEVIFTRMCSCIFYSLFKARVEKIKNQFGLLAAHSCPAFRPFSVTGCDVKFDK